MRNFSVFLRFLLSFLCAFTASGYVVLTRNNVTSFFEDIEAKFAPSVKESGIRGTLYMADPLDACSSLTNKVVKSNNSENPFALIIRGGCSFDHKVRKAQDSGFKAAIIYDNEIGDLVPMAGNFAGINIHAVFISKSSGETMAKYVGFADLQVLIVPVYESSAWSIMAISFISLLAMSAMLATCFFVRRHRIRRERSEIVRVREFHGMSRRLVKAMPSLTFTVVLDDSCTSSTCAICLEDYNVGEKLRVLPCRHKFHAPCVDAWLTTWRTFCPVCKRDARTNSGESPASESTPLLSASRSSSVLSSFRSASSAIQIGQRSLPSPSVSLPQSISSIPYNHHSLRSYHQSPHQNLDRNSVYMRTASSQRSLGSYLISPSSFGYPSLSPLNSRYLSPYIPSPSNGSSYVGFSTQQPNTLHYSESAASFSPFTSARSLPGVD